MIYLKTYFSAKHEIKFLKLNIQESFPYVDKVILCEFNRTHTGKERELIFDHHIHHFSREEQQKIIYIGADISNLTQYSVTDSNIIHTNERLMRGYFASQIDLKNNDIIFSVDADEILYGKTYPAIVKRINRFNQAFLLTLNQFFYKINYLWTDKDFQAPTACQARYYKNDYPAQWRYDGKPFKEKAGCHFSWCLTIDEMIDKLGRYSHTQDYGHLAKREILEKAVRDKEYPFSLTKFTIEVLDMNINRNIFPRALFPMIESFDYLIESE